MSDGHLLEPQSFVQHFCVRHRKAGQGKVREKALLKDFTWACAGPIRNLEFPLVFLEEEIQRRVSGLEGLIHGQWLSCNQAR